MSGEHPKGRTAMDGMVKQLIQDGWPAKKAEDAAKQAAIRNDQRRNGIRPS